MGTYIEFEPTSHATKVTRLVRIDNDFRITLAVDDNGTLTEHFFNFQAIPDEYLFKPSPPDDNLMFAQLAKEGAAESLVVRIRMFFNAEDDTLEPYHIPRAWSYSSPIDKNNYLPTATLPETVNQVFPIVIWNTLKPSQTLPGANTAMAPTFDRLFTRLSTLTERRNHLKQPLLTKLFSRAMPFWMMGAGEAAHQQAFAHWIEMLVRALAIDANLATEARFNLLHGEIGLDFYEFAYKVSNAGITDTGGALASMTRTEWTGYVRFGAVASSTPYAYTPPSGNTWTGSTSNVAGLTLTGVPAALRDNNGRGWIDWITLA